MKKKERFYEQPAELEKRLPTKLGAPSIFPSNWTIDPVKLACVLRISDAIQIDDRRAPSFLRTIRKLSVYSENHWKFQQKLYQPRIERNRIIFSSKSPFRIDEVDSWWICYDTLQMIDYELKEVDSLLADSNRIRLNAVGVVSIEDPKRLSKLITVQGWQHVDTKIKVSNVAKLVSCLGGEQLYGNNALVPIRELIQNASDAIRASRILEEENPKFGKISIKIAQDTEGKFIEIQDNGIEMSQKVLTGPLLDFGETFWGTSLMHEELPDLESKGFSPTGLYGIGFFSVFILGDKVTVTSKKFVEARGSSLTLEFNQGITSRPILREATPDEIIKDGGTIVKVWVKSNTFHKLFESRSHRHKKISLAELIESLCPKIDCNIEINEHGKTERVINANDWITIPPIDVIKRLMGRSFYKELSKKVKMFLDQLAENMALIEDEGVGVVGRVLIFKQGIGRRSENNFPVSGIVTLGGLRSCELAGLIGFFVGIPVRASRDIGIPIVSSNSLSEWASNQADLPQILNLDNQTQIYCSSLIRVCRGNIKKLMVAYHKKGCLNYQSMLEIIKSLNIDKYLIVQDAAISLYEHENKCKIEFNENVIWVDVGLPGILQTNSPDQFIDWPANRTFFNKCTFSDTLEGLTTMALCEHWNCSIKELEESSKMSTNTKSFEVVGKVNDKEVVIDNLDIIIKPKKNKAKHATIH
jgi:Histidine kinase-, DNA gyrase B-, and HSP90-like ATPase